jgi:signal transduction histidine kinase
MAELIGGKLAVTSKPGVGTRVSMDFPSQAFAAAPLTTSQRKYG